MRNIAVVIVLAATFVSTEASARKMSTMEWMDPKAMEIWKTLTPQEKTESVDDMLKQSDPGLENKKYLVDKVQACLDKEVADPDYQGTQVPMFIPWTSCATKYTAIADSKRK